jgi:hypothetical protein
MTLLSFAVLACRHPEVALPDPSAPPTPTPAELRRREDRQRAGVDAFMTGMADRPELWWAAYQAAYDGLVFCERSRSAQFYCRDENVARYREVRAATPALDGASLPPSGVRWTTRAAAGCDAVLAALAPPPPPPAPTIEATLELDRCVFTRSPSVWTAARCPVHRYADACEDGSLPEPGVVHCVSGTPCAQPPSTCPCRMYDRAIHVDVRGRMIVGGQIHPLEDLAEWHESATIGLLEPTPPDPVGVDDLVAPRFSGGLAYAAGVLDLLEPSEPDTLAVRCATFASGRDLFGLSRLAAARCADAFLREPQPLAPPEPEPEATDPQVARDRYPHRARVLDDAERRATETALERRSPGWDFDVSALGYIEGGRLADDAQPADAARALAAAQFLALGFDAPPPVTSTGADRAVLLDSPWFVELVARTDGIRLRGHGWPLECPEPDRAALLAPFVGRPITITPLFQPCDPVRAGDCEPQDLTPQDGRLAPVHVSTRPFVAIVPDGDDVTLHCAVALGLDARVRLAGPPLPTVVDLISGEVLPDAISETQLPTRTAASP